MLLHVIYQFLIGSPSLSSSLPEAAVMKSTIVQTPTGIRKTKPNKQCDIVVTHKTVRISIARSVPILRV